MRYSFGIFDDGYGGYEVVKYCEDEYWVLARFNEYEDAEQWMWNMGL